MTEIAIPGLTSPFDAIRRMDDRGECWSARDLMPVMGYGADWRNFVAAIDRAKVACRNTGADPESNFGDATKVAQRGPAAADYRLSRYAAYLVAMNGDPRKKEIADAQTYFAVKTREAETGRLAPAEITRKELARMVLESEEARELAEARVLELEPSARAWDTLASADGDFSVADAAKVLSRDSAIKLGRDRLFTLLRDYGWIYRQRSDGRWRVKQTAVETGRLSELPSSHYHPRTGELVLDPPLVRVTAKGVRELHKRLGGTSTLSELTPAPEVSAA
jgi:DNA-damage-inducible protein D